MKLKNVRIVCAAKTFNGVDTAFDPIELRRFIGEADGEIREAREKFFVPKYIEFEFDDGVVLVYSLVHEEFWVCE